MKKSWGLIPKILDGRKKIESRWGVNRCAPWDRVTIGDVVYFKDAGEKVSVKANVSEVRSFENLTLNKVRGILEKYGGDDGIAVSDLEETIAWARGKKYCTLIFLKDPERVVPFAIDKRGFGAGAAWISVPDVNKIRRGD